MGRQFDQVPTLVLKAPLHEPRIWDLPKGSFWRWNLFTVLPTRKSQYPVQRG
jgi:hypothetical protein